MVFNLHFDQFVHYVVMEGRRQKLSRQIQQAYWPLTHSEAAWASNNRDLLSFPGKACSWAGSGIWGRVNREERTHQWRELGRYRSCPVQTEIRCIAGPLKGNIRSQPFPLETKLPLQTLTARQPVSAMTGSLQRIHKLRGLDIWSPL